MKTAAHITEPTTVTSTSTPAPTLAPRDTTCRLRYIHKPDFQRYTGTYWGAWLKDSRPSASTSPDVIWVSLHYSGSTLLEYATYEDFRHEHATTVHELDEPYTGTGHVVFAAAFYYHCAGSRDIIRYDLAARSVTGRLTLSDLAVDTDNYLYGNEFNHVDLAADENGLWAVYASSAHDQLRVAKILTTSTMSVDISWTLPTRHVDYGNGFLACGVLYLVRDTRVKTTTVDFAYDMYTESEIDGVRLSFTNPFQMNNMLAYNAADRTLLSWDKGNQLVYRLLT